MTTAPSHPSVLAPAYHDDAETNGPNSFGKLAVERAYGRLGWTWPLVFCVIRFPLLVAGFVVALWVYRSTDGAHAGELAQAFTRYNMPLLADVVCIGLLLWRVRRTPAFEARRQMRSGRGGRLHVGFSRASVSARRDGLV